MWLRVCVAVEAGAASWAQHPKPNSHCLIKALWLLAESQLGHGGCSQGARLPAPGTVPRPVPALGAVLTQPEAPYLAPAPPPGRRVTATGSPPPPPSEAPAKRPAPPHAF